MAFFILSTGSELSSGRSKDTNAPEIAAALTSSGYEIAGFATLPDDQPMLKSTIVHLLSAGIQGIIMTGGLGPTDDDHTVDVLAALSNSGTVEEPEALRKLEVLMKRYQGRFQEASARRQIRVVEGSTVLRNERGMAPGIVVRIGSGIVAAMPGVPQEMRLMLSAQLLPYLKAEFPVNPKQRREFYIYGVGESRFQSELMTPFVKEKLPEDFVWGVTAGKGHLKVFAESVDGGPLASLHLEACRLYAGLVIDRPAEDALHDYCTENKIKISFAESCTGGLVGKLLTDRAGSSAYFVGSAVVYANQAKERILGVSTDVLEQKGAVSVECAAAMAEGALRVYDTDFSAAITGIAGPDGGSPGKPVGTVCIACAGKGRETLSEIAHFPLDRDRVREYSAHAAVFRLLRYMTAQ